MDHFQNGDTKIYVEEILHFSNFPYNLQSFKKQEYASSLLVVHKNIRMIISVFFWVKAEVTKNKPNFVHKRMCKLLILPESSFTKIQGECCANIFLWYMLHLCYILKIHFELLTLVRCFLLIFFSFVLIPKKFQSRK